MYRFIVESDNFALISQIHRYCERKGVFTTEIEHYEDVKEREARIERGEPPDVAPPPLPVVRLDYTAFAIVRKGGMEIGHAGVTSKDVHQAINAEINKGINAGKPYIRWLVEGIEKNDISAGVIGVFGDRTSALRRKKEFMDTHRERFILTGGEGVKIQEFDDFQLLDD